MPRASATATGRATRVCKGRSRAERPRYPRGPGRSPRAQRDSGHRRLQAARIESVGNRSGTGDYLALDSDTGRLVHLHLHYRLTVGDSFLSGYRLPWEALVLSTRHFDTTMAMYVADPHMELVLLIARQAIRLGPIDRIAAWVGRPWLGALARLE